MVKQDLREYGSGELSLHVMNDEGLYRQRHASGLREMLDEHFLYTDEQWSELQDDLTADAEETERWDALDAESDEEE